MKHILALAMIAVLSACGSDPKVSTVSVPGPAGARGPAGPSGTNGIGISSSTSCGVIASGLYFIYNVVTFGSGDKWVKCSVVDTYYSVEQSSIYLASQSGAVTEGCSVGSDVDAASGGYWRFTNTSVARTAVYNDPGSADDGFTVTFASGDCSTMTP